MPKCLRTATKKGNIASDLVSTTTSAIQFTTTSLNLLYIAKEQNGQGDIWLPKSVLCLCTGSVAAGNVQVAEVDAAWLVVSVGKQV